MSNQNKRRGRPRPWVLSCHWIRLLRTTSVTVLDQNGWSACARDGSTNVPHTGCGRKRIVLLLLCSVMNEFYSKNHILKGLHALVFFFSLGDR